VIHPSEDHLAFSSQDDLKTAMIEVVAQMIKEGSFIPFGLAD